MSFFDSELFEQLRVAHGVTWGRPVRALEQCASTNDLALEAVATDAKTGIVFLAREQTQGRGRRGNRWLAPAGECLTFSVLLRYPPGQTNVSGLSLATGLAALDVVVARVPSPERVSFKWPNDVYVGDKKLCGVLIESKPDGQGHLGVVIGIGLNWLVSEFPPQLTRATSLALQGAPAESLESLLVDVLGQLQLRVTQLLKNGVASLASEACERDYLLGRNIQVENQRGVGAGIDAHGRLILRNEQGRLHAISAGHIEVSD